MNWWLLCQTAKLASHSRRPPRDSHKQLRWGAGGHLQRGADRDAPRVQTPGHHRQGAANLHHGRGGGGMRHPRAGSPAPAINFKNYLFWGILGGSNTENVWSCFAFNTNLKKFPNVTCRF